MNVLGILIAMVLGYAIAMGLIFVCSSHSEPTHDHGQGFLEHVRKDAAKIKLVAVTKRLLGHKEEKAYTYRQGKQAAPRKKRY